MKKIVCGGALLVALALVAVVLAPNASAQQRGRSIPPVPPEPPTPFSFNDVDSSIGVSVRDQPSDETAGVRIESVQGGTPATRAGLQAGDVVVEFDGERIRSARQFTRLVRETPSGRAVKMTVLRSGSRRTLDITPEARNRFAFDDLPNARVDLDRTLRSIPRNFNFDYQPFLGEGPFGSGRRLGVTASPLTDQLATYFGVKDGVLISEVNSNSPAASAGLKAGDVITSANGHAVTSVADLTREVRDAPPGSSVELRVTRDRKEISMKVAIPERQRRVTPGVQPI